MQDAATTEREGVCVVWMSRTETKARFTHSLFDLIRADQLRLRDGQRPHIRQWAGSIPGARVAEGRNQLVDVFAGTECEWLLMLDDDMTFDNDLLERLLAVADRRERPVVGGLCFAGAFGARVYPTLYESGNDERGNWVVSPVVDYPRDALVRVAATGAACLLVHHSVFAVMARPGPKRGERFDPAVHGFGTLLDGRRNPYPWFEEGRATAEGAGVGEDIAFCRKLGLLGIPIHVHTGIKLGHIKEWVVGEESFDAYRAELERPSQDSIRRAIAAVKPGPERERMARYLAPRPCLLNPAEVAGKEIEGGDIGRAGPSLRDVLAEAGAA